MKYDTWDHVCDFPVKELNVLIGHYVTNRCFTDTKTTTTPIIIMDIMTWPKKRFRQVLPFNSFISVTI